MIYLDSAATTLQKPNAVSAAMVRALRTMASPGRGGHLPAQRAARTAYECREAVCELFGMDDPERVVFTFNATHALNLAIKSVVKPGDTVLISGYEHNAVSRTLYGMPDITVKVARAPLFSPEEMLERMKTLLTDEVSAVVCTHVSNAFGYILPVDDIARLCREKGVRLIVDAAQSAGCLPVRMKAWGASFVAMPGHKGLYGPQGTGLLLCADRTEPLLLGGTGSGSRLQKMPEFLPDRLEAGTHNIPGVAGLLEGVRFVRRVGVERIGRYEAMLVERMAEGLGEIRGVRVFAPEHGAVCQSGVLSFCVDGIDCEEVGQRLSRAGFAVRCGLHCAPLAHESAGTLECGTIRASISAFNTGREIQAFVRAVSALKK